MLSTSTLFFLKQLKNNNIKEWMDDNRKLYENAKEDFTVFVNEIISGIAKFDKNILQANLDAKKCITRLNRDVRFSKNKDPYKLNFAAMISMGGKKGNQAMYYVHVQPGECFTGAGVYMPMPPELYKFRQEIDYNFKEWNSIITSKKFIKTYPAGIFSYESLVRTPKGFEEDSPALEYLKMKGFIATAPITDEIITSKTAVKQLLQQFEMAAPVVQFLNNAL